MSELLDLRAKITATTDAWLDAKSAETGKDRCVLVREVLHEIALDDIEKITLAYKQLKAKGLVREG